MTPQERLRVSLASARYLEALEHDDVATLESLWAEAGADPALFVALRELHAGLIEEQQQSEAEHITQRIVEAAETHLTSGDVVRSDAEPITVAEVAEEVFRHPPDRLSADAHQLNARLRAITVSFPLDLGLSDFVTWAEQKYGNAPAAYWRALYDAATKLELRKASEVDFQLAARRANKPEEGKR
jgi:hypothetical protein